MQKKNNRINQRLRQRQKQRRKMILVIAASCMTCLVIGLTIFLNTSQVEKSMAAVNIYTVTDEPPVVSTTLDAPVLKQLPTIGPNTMMVRLLKTESKPATEHHN